MRRIQIVTFKGCQSTVDFRNQLEDLIEARRLDAELDTVLVPSPARSKELQLAGSPTLFLDGVEYQAERRGPAGFY